MYAVGDKVMVLRNLKQYGLTNGMIGFVKEININSQYDTSRGDIGYQTGAVTQGKPIDFKDLHKVEIEFKLTNKKQPEDLDQRQASHIVHVEFDNGTDYQFQSATDYRMLTHAYAVTCHKSQGSEYPNVVILLHHYSSFLLSREWLYTAITRAQNKVFILYTDRALTSALQNQRIKGNTLEEKIKSFVEDKSS